MKEKPLESSSLANQVTLAHREHIEQLNDDHAEALTRKYIKGVREHGGDIRDFTPLQLVEEALAETIDQYTYLHALREKLINADKK